LSDSLDGLDLPIDALRRRRNRKWNRYGPDVIPAWIADMDFRAEPSVHAALMRLLGDEDYGYAERAGTQVERAVAAAFARHQRDLYGWDLDPEMVEPVSDLVQATMATLVAFSDAREGILLQLPAYPPFRQAIDKAGRTIVANPLRDDGRRWTLDVAELEALAPKARVLLICNPHNPTGRVLSHGELAALGRIAVEHDLVLVSDEVHSELVYSGHRHLPTAMVSPDVAARTVTITSATKSFNLGGLRCGVIHFGSSALFDRFRRRLPEWLLGGVNVFGADATIAAWANGQPWLRRVIARLEGNRKRVGDFLAERLPEVRYREPDATYFAWLDLAAFNLRPTAHDFLLSEARVATSAGADFGTEYAAFARLNFATSPAILEKILARVGTALRASGNDAS
jgi:cysteine-S-conjugate beta-lyase